MELELKSIRQQCLPFILLVAVFANMSLSGFGAMFKGVLVMALGGIRVMSRLLVASRIVMLRGGVVMFGGVLVMFRSPCGGAQQLSRT